MFVNCRWRSEAEIRSKKWNESHSRRLLAGHNGASE